MTTVEPRAALLPELLTDVAVRPEEFPSDFVWGAATAAYQVEGAVSEDGRGRSVWDTFCDRPGAIVGGASGAVACDHYHRYREDVALLKQLGVDSYRFSVAWPRILPAGSGAVNEAGLDFYDRLVDELLEAGIAPTATLFHWDTPQALEYVGGWTGREITEHFAAYAGVVGERLGDRVARWMPLNEPNVVTMLGYAIGNHAPGRSLGFGALPVVHHLMLGHGMATQALRSPEWSHSQPRSSGYPPRSCVNARPPSREDASSTSTVSPCAASRRAAPMPAAPPPTMMTSNALSMRGR